MDVLTILRDFGGWGAMLIALVVGGRAFMTLARDFKLETIQMLGQIRDALGQHERRVDRLTDRVEELRGEIGEQSRRIEGLHDIVNRRAGAANP